MMFMPEMNRPFTRRQMDEIVDDSLRLLSEIGIECSEKRTIDRMTSKPGVVHRSGRLKFAPDAVRERMEEIRTANKAHPGAEPPFKLHTSWCCFNYADPDSGQIRSPTVEDAIRMTRFMDARGYGCWPIPLIPSDVNPRHATLACEYIALKHSRYFGGFMPALSPEEIEFLVAMHKAVGRRYMHVEQISISPMRFNDEGLSLAIPLIGRSDCSVLLTGSIPALGATSPLSVRSSLALVLAERLALIICIERLGLPKDNGVGLRLQSFDFQAAKMVFGGPEEMLLRACCNQLVEHVAGAQGRWGQLHSMARTPDQQAAAERCASALWQGLLGIRNFHCAGQLAQDEVFSPIQVMIDEEIMRFAEHTCKGIRHSGSEEDVVSQINAGIEAGTFMAETATVENFRDFCFWPGIFSRDSVPRWTELGRPSTAELAKREMEKSLEKQNFEVPISHTEDLDEIYGEALNSIG